MSSVHLSTCIRVVSLAVVLVSVLLSVLMLLGEPGRDHLNNLSVLVDGPDPLWVPNHTETEYLQAWYGVSDASELSRDHSWVSVDDRDHWPSGGVMVRKENGPYNTIISRRSHTDQFQITCPMGEECNLYTDIYSTAQRLVKTRQRLLQQLAEATYYLYAHTHSSTTFRLSDQWSITAPHVFHDGQILDNPIRDWHWAPNSFVRHDLDGMAPYYSPRLSKRSVDKPIDSPSDQKWRCHIPPKSPGGKDCTQEFALDGMDGNGRYYGTKCDIQFVELKFDVFARYSWPSGLRYPSVPTLTVSFQPSEMRPYIGMPIAVIGYPKPDGLSMTGFRGTHTGPIDFRLKAIFYHEYRDLAIAFGRILFVDPVDPRFFVHDASVSGGMAGGPIIAVEELNRTFNSTLPFIGVQSRSWSDGWSMAVSIEHDHFWGEYARHMHDFNRDELLHFRRAIANGLLPTHPRVTIYHNLHTWLSSRQHYNQLMSQAMEVEP